jgi:hypothetical protein
VSRGWISKAKGKEDARKHDYCAVVMMLGRLEEKKKKKKT